MQNTRYQIQDTKYQPPELLCPAGNWASLRAAVENGADSVYFGVKGVNMRHFANNFDPLEIAKVMEYLRENNKKGYLALNVVVKNDELEKIRKILEEAKRANVDAVILWDMAVFAIAKELGLKIHLSTQASVSNKEALRFFARLGAKRVVLARECTLSDIRDILAAIKDEDLGCEIETFIHGAMCVSISGRCFLSYYSHGKSANRGECLQPCRREYVVKDKEETVEYLLGDDYVLSPKDLCVMDFIDTLIESGIHSFKIEGRMRSPEYLKVVTSCYRQAIDAFFDGNLTAELKQELQAKLATVYNRGFSTGFYFGQPQDAYSRENEHLYEKMFVGEVTRFFKKISVAEVKLRSADLMKGQQLLFIGKSTAAPTMTVEEMQKENAFVEKAEKGDVIGLKVPFVVKPRDKVFLWRKK